MKYWDFSKDKESNVTSFYLSPGEDFNTWMHQNKAEYTGAFVDGCLLDSFVVSTKRGYAFMYEHARSAWTSDYTVYFVPYTELKKGSGNAADKLWAAWYEFEDAAAEKETA